MNIRSSLLKLLLLLACWPLAASAGHREKVSLSLRDLDTGAVLQVHAHRGQQHVAGRAGHRYAVQLRNLTGERVLVVLSVDGVNAVSGETAATAQTGYVLAPYQSTEIRGWRKSLHEVAEFTFADLPDSYAARTGRPDNVGVIGIAVFEEKAPRYQPPAPAIGGRANAPASAAAPREAEQARADSSERKAQSLGTGHGARRYDPAQHVAFERASTRPAQLSRLYYDSRENLIAAGIIRVPRYRHDPRPDPFPIGFVPDPR